MNELLIKAKILSNCSSKSNLYKNKSINKILYDVTKKNDKINFKDLTPFLYSIEIERLLKMLNTQNKYIKELEDENKILKFSKKKENNLKILEKNKNLKKDYFNLQINKVYEQVNKKFIKNENYYNMNSTKFSNSNKYLSTEKLKRSSYKSRDFTKKIILKKTYFN